jgi:hypothetical protein
MATMIEVKFTCNVCETEFVSKGLVRREPIGWGTVRPTLRINPGPWPKAKKEQDARLEFERTCSDLKSKLCEKEYHLCHKCLTTAHLNIVQIEDGKKRAMK